MKPVGIFNRRWQCEYCDFAGSASDVQAHEASHFGLSVQDYRHWLDLEQNVRNSICYKSFRNQDVYRAIRGKAVAEKLAFEELHGVTWRKPKN